MSDAIANNLIQVMSPEELAAIRELVQFHGAPWPIGPVEIRSADGAVCSRASSELILTVCNQGGLIRVDSPASQSGLRDPRGNAGRSFTDSGGRNVSCDCDCDCEKRLRGLLTHDHMAIRVTIWHPGHEWPDDVHIQLMADEMDAVHGKGKTISEAIDDLEMIKRLLDAKQEIG